MIPTHYVVAPDPAARNGECLGCLHRDSVKTEEYITLHVLSAPGVDPGRTMLTVKYSEIRRATESDFHRFRVELPPDFVPEPDRRFP